MDKDTKAMFVNKVRLFLLVYRFVNSTLKDKHVTRNVYIYIYIATYPPFHGAIGLAGSFERVVKGFP